MAWWEILLIVLSVAIGLPFTLAVWIAFINSITNAVKKYKIRRDMEKHFKELTDLLSHPPESIKTNEEIRQQFFKDIEKMKEKFKEETKNDDNCD